MYPLYHEMDVTRFYKEMERRYKEAYKTYSDLIYYSKKL